MFIYTENQESPLGNKVGAITLKMEKQDLFEKKII